MKNLFLGLQIGIGLLFSATSFGMEAYVAGFCDPLDQGCLITDSDNAVTCHSRNSSSRKLPNGDFVCCDSKNFSDCDVSKIYRSHEENEPEDLFADPPQKSKSNDSFRFGSYEEQSPENIFKDSDFHIPEMNSLEARSEMY